MTMLDQIEEQLNLWKNKLSLWESVVQREIDRKDHEQANDWQNRCEILKCCIAEIETILKQHEAEKD